MGSLSRKIFSSIMAMILLFTVIPIHSFASENLSEEITEESFNQLELVDSLLESDFMNFKDMTDVLTYEENFITYQENIQENQEGSEIQPYNIFRLLFSLVKSGTNYIVKVTSKGKTIKNVRNGKLEVDVNKHINAKNRFEKYGNMDKLVKYIVEDIRRVDAAGLVKNGDNSIKTIYGKDAKLLEIRFHVKNGELYQFNAFPDHSKRELGNVIYLAPQ